MVNPNYPVIAEEWGPAWTAAGAAVPSTRWVNLIDRTLSQASARRGKQYELDQPQAGEYGITLGSQDGALDPTNTAGPWAGKIQPYQPYRRRAQWPPTANLLDAAIATGGEGYAAMTWPGTFGVKSTSDVTGGVVAVPSGSLTAYQGTNTLRMAVKSGQGSGTRIAYTDTVAARPGQTYTFQARVRNITDSTSLVVKPVIAFYGGADTTSAPVTFIYGSTSTLTGSASTNSWTLITVTATAPTTGGVYGMCAGFSTGASVPSAITVESDAWQLELGSAATTWAAPGTWYPIFTGFTERWPTTWTDGGTYGQVQPTGVDTFALLSQVALKDVFLEEIDSHSPRYCYTLADAAGSTSFADLTGQMPPIPAINSKQGPGNWTAGTSITSVSPTGAYTGSTGSVVNSNPVNPGKDSPAASATVLDLPSVGVTGPGYDSNGGWTRMLAFRWTDSLPPTNKAVLWETRRTDAEALGGYKVYIDSTGVLMIDFTAFGGSVTGLSTATLAANVADGNWHLVMFANDGNTLQRVCVDGHPMDVTIAFTWFNQSIRSDYVGASYFNTTRNAYRVFKGDLAFVTEWPTLLSQADMSALYTTWKNSAANESSDARYARILRYSGYKGASTIGAGMTTAMGPADGLSGMDAMSALNDVVTTENGEHFVAADGTVVFRGRGARYSALTPALIFGDGPGELPFEDLQLDFDATHLGNDVQVTQTPTGAVFTAKDTASQARYYSRTMTRSLNSASALECQDAANYLKGRYSQPLTRVQSLKLHPAATPSLWPSLLALELGTRVRINRRPPGAPMVSAECFVEQIQWDMDGSGDAFVTLQCSPVDPAPYAQFSDTLPQFDVAVFAY
ncbi:hypothetical protein [Streptomyces collinus]